MSPILYHCTESQVSRFVEVVIKLLDANIELKYLDMFNKAHLADEFVKINPRHQVPFFVDDDLKIGESRAIATYLVETYGKEDNTLYPKDIKQRAKVDELLYFDAAHLLNTQMMYTMPKLYCYGDLVEQHLPKYQECLNYLESRLDEGRKFFLGDSITLADLSIACTLAIKEMCGYCLEGCPKLNKFLHTMHKELPCHEQMEKDATETCVRYMKEQALKNEPHD